MSETSACKFCGKSPLTEEETTETCERCWYGQRLAPDEWEAELRAEGRPKPIYRGGHVDMPGGGWGQRDPYVPALALVSKEEP